MQKNVSGQKWIVFAFDRTDNTPKTGDAANITANLRIDGGSANAVDDTNPTELEDGFYYFDITQAESNGDYILICPASTTSDIQVIGCPAALYTTAPNFNALGIESDGDLTKVNTLDGHTAQTGDNYARLGAPAGASIAADIATVDGVVDGIQTDLDNATDGLGALKALIDTVDGVVDAIKAVTDNLPDSGALTSIAQASDLATVASYIDTEIGTIDGVVDAIKAVTDNLPDSGALTSLLPAAVITALKASTGYTAGGTTTFANAFKIILAVMAGDFRDKSGESGTYEILDADDGSTVIAEVIPSTSTPYKNVTLQ